VSAPGIRPELVSFVVPAHNEEESLPVLVEEIREAARALGQPYEIVVVDDGSTDTTGAWLKSQAERSEDLVVLYTAHNHGQSAAMAAGMQASGGAVIVTLDADLQNDPADAPRLVEALADCDLACGVRRKRKDSAAKRLGSRFANAFRRWWLHDEFRDVGCTLKAWKRPVAERIPKFRGFHRFIPILAKAEGFRIREIEVAHRPRRHGETHYGNLGRAWKGLFDLFGVRWLLRRRVALDYDRLKGPAGGESR